jgi:hypothetical protein
MTSALEGGEWLASRPGRTLPPGKTRYPLHRRLGGPQGRFGQVRKISPPPGFDPRTVQPVAQSLYRLSYRTVSRVRGRFYNIFELSRLFSREQETECVPTVLHACIVHSNRKGQTAAFHILSLNLHMIICIVAVLFKMHMLCCVILHMLPCDITKWHC